MSIKPKKMTVADAIAVSPRLAQMLENIRAAEQMGWESQMEIELVDSGVERTVAKYAAKHSRASSTAKERAQRTQAILNELGRIAREG